MSDSRIAAILADKKNTRAALAAALVEANTEREALRNALALARIERNDALTRVNTQRPLPAHFAAARELAMRTGRCVKVGA